MKANLILAVAALLLAAGCTTAEYGDAKITSFLQKRTLVVRVDPDGNLQELRYSSGSDPIFINTPYGTVGAREER